MCLILWIERSPFYWWSELGWAKLFLFYKSHKNVQVVSLRVEYHSKLDWYPLNRTWSTGLVWVPQGLCEVWCIMVKHIKKKNGLVIVINNASVNKCMAPCMSSRCLSALCSRYILSIMGGNVCWKASWWSYLIFYSTHDFTFASSWLNQASALCSFVGRFIHV